MRRIGTKWKPSKPLARMTLEEMRAFQEEHKGDFIAVPLENEFGYGRNICGSSFGFYDLLRDMPPSLEEIEKARMLFIVPVEFRVMTSGHWRLLGNRPLGKALDVPVKYFRYRPNFVDIYVGGRFQPYAGEDLTTMERLVVWSARHVEERLQCHFNGSVDEQTKAFMIPREETEKFQREYVERQRAGGEKS